MSPSPIRLSIVIPTFNERDNVEILLARIAKVLGPDGWEAIFVDDDSPDGTAPQIRQLARENHRIRCLQRIGRRGLSSACIEGMLAASAPVIAVMDADLQHDETILTTMFERIKAGADVVIGSRYAEGGGTGSWDTERRKMSLLATRLSHLVLRQPVSDPMSGFFMLRREALEGCVRRLSGIGFKILVDLLASTERPLRIEEVPYHFRERAHGESKLDTLVVWEYGMLLADKMVGRYVPVRFLAFAAIGGLGVLVHMAVLSLALQGFGMGFALAQSAATGLTMVFNFAVNNMLTYRDRKLEGIAWVRGLLSFMIACGIGAIANVGIATYLFEQGARWVPSALSGILVGAVWNYTVTRFYTWGNNTTRR